MLGIGKTIFNYNFNQCKSAGFKTMLSLSGPVPIQVTGTPIAVSTNSTYFLAFSGKSSQFVIFVISVFQPGSF